MMGGDIREVGKIKIQNSGKNRQIRQIIRFCLIIVPPKIVMLVFSSHFLMVFIGCLPLTKSKMTIEHPQFEDVFPIKHGDFPASHFSFQGCNHSAKTSQKRVLGLWGSNLKVRQSILFSSQKLFLSTIEWIEFLPPFWTYIYIHAYIFILYNVIYDFIYDLTYVYLKQHIYITYRCTLIIQH